MANINNLQNTNIFEGFDDLLTPKQVQNLIGVSENYLQKLRLKDYNKDKNGELRRDFLPFVKFGKAVRYKKADVLAWISRNTISEI